MTSCCRALLGLAVALSFAVYWTLPGSFFFADDFVMLYDLRNSGPLEFVLTPYGGHVLYVRNLLFWALHSVFGSDARGYFTFALLLHLTNVALAFSVLRRVTANPWIAFVGAALWGTNAGNAIPLGWVSVHGQVLTGSLALVALLAILREATPNTSSSAGAAGEPSSEAHPAHDSNSNPYPYPRLQRSIPGPSLALACGCMLLAGASFGIGIGLGLVFPLAALLVLSAQPRSHRWRLLALPALLVILYLSARPIHATVSTRPLPLELPASALVRYLPSIVELTVRLMGAGLTPLFTGFIRPLYQLPTWLPLLSLVVLSLGLVSAAIATNRPRAAAPASPATPSIMPHDRAQIARLAVVFFLLAVANYAIIAAGRAPLAGTARYNTLPMIALAPRFHYTGPLFLTLCLGTVLAALLQEILRERHIVAGAISALVLLVAGIGVYARSDFRVDLHARARQEVDVVLESARARTPEAPAGDLLVSNKRFAGVGPVFFNNPKLFPGWAAAYLIFADHSSEATRRVRFVEANREVVAEVTRDRARPIASLLVPPPE